MGTISTKNSLTDFDMCLALSQSAINTQLEYAWKAWKRRSGFKDRIEVFKIKSGDKLVDSKYGLSVTIAPLTIDLNVPDGKAAQVRVTLPLTSGKVVYYDEVTEERAEYPVKDWSVSFVTDLDKRAVDLATLKRIEPDAGKTAAEFIAKSGLPEGVFSIEYLFLKLTSVDLMLSGNKDVRIPPAVPASARNKALSTLNLLLQGEMGDFMLGTVVRRSGKSAAPTFALTDFLFDVQANREAANAGTLNYLGVFSGRPMPADSNAARLKLKDMWLRPGQTDGTGALISGVMAIGNHIFLEKYLIPKFREALASVNWSATLGGAGIGRPGNYQGPAPVRDKLKWTFSETLTSSQEIPDAIGRHLLELTQKYTLSVEVKPSASPQAAVSGRIECMVHDDGVPPFVTDKNLHTQWIYVDGHQDFTGSLTLTGNGIGVDFNLEAVLTHAFKDAAIDRKEVGGINVFNFVTVLAKGIGLISATAEEMFAELQKKTSEALLSTVEAALARLKANLKEQVFIPAGGGVLTFQNPGFSNAGDLFFEVIYRAP